MVCQSLRLSLGDFRESWLECARDCCMQVCAPGLQQAGIRSVSHQHVLKGIDRMRYLAPAEYKLRQNQLAERLLQLLSRNPGDGVQQFVRERATHHSADLCHLPYRRKPVETRYQRIMQGGRNR